MMLSSSVDTRTLAVSTSFLIPLLCFISSIATLFASLSGSHSLNKSSTLTSIVCLVLLESLYAITRAFFSELYVMLSTIEPTPNLTSEIELWPSLPITDKVLVAAL